MSTPTDGLSRRDFLARTGAGAALLSVAPLTGALAAPAPAAVPRRAGLPIGIEMFAVRKELARDLPNTLKTVREIGYEAVEFFAPYLAWTLPYAKQVRTMIDDLGLRCFSTHNGIASFTPGDMMTKAIEINQILGAKHVILASPGMETGTAEEWKRLATTLTAAADMMRPHGLLAGMHNHEAEWADVGGGQRVMHVIAANTPADVVLQLDVGTCVKSGVDPVAWIRANPGRIRSAHLKDWAPGTDAEEKNFRVLFGEGTSPWAAIVEALESGGGVEYYLMEQEGSRFPEFETAGRCLASWRRLRGRR